MKELRLRVTQCKAHQIGNLSHINKAVMNFLESQVLCTRDAHLEDVQVFGYKKRKANVLIGAEKETHRPDTVNFSRSQIERTLLEPWSGNYV